MSSIVKCRRSVSLLFRMLAQAQCPHPYNQQCTPVYTAINNTDERNLARRNHLFAQRRGTSEAGVVVGQKSLVVVRLLGFLDTTTDSRNIGLERLVLGHCRFLPVINYCLPYDSSLIDGDASPDESLDVKRHRELDWLLQVHHNSVPARFHLRSIF